MTDTDKKKQCEPPDKGEDRKQEETCPDSRCTCYADGLIYMESSEAFLPGYYDPEEGTSGFFMRVY